MTKEAFTGDLVVGGELKGFEKSSDADDDLVGLFVLGHTEIVRNDPVCTGLVDTGDYLLASVHAEGCLHLVAVVIRVLHADDFLHMAEGAKEFYAVALLPAELGFVVHILKLAAAALLIYGTLRKVCLFRGRLWAWFCIFSVLYNISLPVFHRIVPLSLLVLLYHSSGEIAL